MSTKEDFQMLKQYLVKLVSIFIYIFLILLFINTIELMVHNCTKIQVDKTDLKQFFLNLYIV